MTDDRFHDDDLAGINHTDDWLDDVHRRRPPARDPLARALSSWLDDIDRDNTMHPAHTGVTQIRSDRRRRAVVGSIAAFALIACAGTAAAATPGSPIHRALFGQPTSSPTKAALVAEATRLLDDAERIIMRARAEGTLADPDRTGALALLHLALQAINGLPDGSTKRALLARHDNLAHRIATLADATPTSPTPMTDSRQPQTLPTSRPSAQPEASGSATIARTFENVRPPASVTQGPSPDRSTAESDAESSPAESGAHESPQPSGSNTDTGDTGTATQSPDSASDDSPESSSPATATNAD